MKKWGLIICNCLWVLSCTPQNGISEKDLRLLMEQEKKNEEMSKRAGDVSKITIIDNPEQVVSVKKIVAEKAEQYQKKIQKEQEKESLTDRYKAGDKTVVPALVAILRGDNKSAKADVYHGLDGRYDGPQGYSIADPELAKAILDGIDRLEDEKSAIQLAGIMSVPGYAYKMEARLLSGKSQDLGRLVYWLGVDGKSITSLHYIIKQVLDKKINLEETEWVMTGIKEYSQNGDAKVKQMVVNFCYQLYDGNYISKKKYNEMKSMSSTANPAEDVVEILLHLGDSRIIPMASDLLKRGIKEVHAIEALIRLEGNKHKETVIKYLRNEDKFGDGLFGLKILYMQTGEEGLLKELFFELARKKELSQYELEKVVDALKQMNVLSYPERPEVLESHPELKRKIIEACRLSNISPEGLAADMYKMRITDKPVSEEIIKKVKEAIQTDDQGGMVQSMLGYLNRFLWFDAEVGVVPVDYVQLLKDFVNHSDGKLSGTLVWADQVEQGDQFIYTITLIANNKVYMVSPEDMGDWYNVGTVITLMNKVLEDAGSKERFVLLNTGDQMALVIFGHEEKIIPFATKYGLLHTEKEE